MFSMVTRFMNYSQQRVRAAKYIGQGFIITLSHANRSPERRDGDKSCYSMMGEEENHHKSEKYSSMTSGQASSRR